MRDKLGQQIYAKIKNDDLGTFVGSVAGFLDRWRRIKQAELRHLLQRVKYRRTAPHPYRLIEVNTRDIDHILFPRFTSERNRYGCHIVSGEWDISVSDKEVFFHEDYTESTERTIVKLDNYELYQSFVEHFEDGVSWEKTQFFQEMQSRSSDIASGYYSAENLEKRFEGLDELYENIKREGYRTQAEIRTQERAPLDHDVPLLERNVPELNEVTVNIGRNGEMIVDEGFHRFSIAKILALKIPVRVFVRHSLWQERRAAVADAVSVHDVEPSVMEYIDHPDMQDLVGDR